MAGTSSLPGLCTQFISIGAIFQILVNHEFEKIVEHQTLDVAASLKRNEKLAN